jgi:hypothetical protein
MIIPCNTRALTWTKPDGSRGSFRPTGPLLTNNASGFASNPAELLSTKTWSARLFVGLSVGKKAAWSLDDVVSAVRSYQRGKRRPEDSSFVLQRGVYTHQVSAGRRKTVVEEDSVQIIMLLTSSRPSPRGWQKQILGLAEHLAKKLKQESVIVEFQEGGVSQGTYAVTP